MHAETIPPPILRAWHKELDRLRAAGTPVDARVEADVLRALMDRQEAGVGVPASQAQTRVRTATLVQLGDAPLNLLSILPAPDPTTIPTLVGDQAAPPLPVGAASLLDDRPRPAPPEPQPPEAPPRRAGIGRPLDALTTAPGRSGRPPAPASPPQSAEDLLDDAFDGLHSLSDTELAELMEEVEGGRGSGAQSLYDPEDARLWQTLFDVDPRMAEKVPAGPRRSAPTNPALSLDEVRVPTREGAEVQERTSKTDPRAPARAADPLDEIGSSILGDGPRYTGFGGVLSGAQGMVRTLKDHDLGRTVILKRLHAASKSKDLKVDQFIAEAKLTAQLEHPHIVPVYDVGRLSDGSIYYTMRRIEGIPLSALIEKARAGDVRAQEQLSLTRCVTLTLQLCRALEYAHRRGVVHRDLKTENVMVTPHGDAMLMDWGLAKIVEPAAGDEDLTHDSVLANPRRYQTTLGTVKGTPAYMAPEQAMGRVNLVDARTDVYSLGAILYELLTFHPPFSGRTIREVLGLLMVETPVAPRQRCPDRGIPARVEAICLRCLEKDPDDRYLGAKELAGDLEAFVDGGRLYLKAEGMYVAGRQALEAAEAAEGRREGLVAEVAQARAAAAQGGDAARQTLWDAQDRLDALDRQIGADTAAAHQALSSCLACLPDHDDARLHLDRLYARQEATAAAAGDPAELCAVRERRQALGKGSRAQPQGLISLSPSPPASQVALARYQARGRLMEAVPVEVPGGGLPMRLPLPEGSYVCTLSCDRHTSVTYPIYVEAGGHWKGFVQLPSEGSVGIDYAQIPAGPVRLGGGPARAWDRVAWLPTYVIGKEPVTLGEYLVFLDDMVRRGQPVRELIPRTAGQGAMVFQDEDGAWAPARSDLVAEDVPDEELRSLPIVGVSFHQAMAFCQWRSVVTRAVHRLPTTEEWEKAARGVDGRIYPWGGRFDDSLCHLSTTPGPSVGLRPVGSCPTDLSPYGVKDVAGGVREWCTRAGEEDARLYPTRGGSWMDGPQEAPLWRSRTVYAGEALGDLGFRLVREVSSGQGGR